MTTPDPKTGTETKTLTDITTGTDLHVPAGTGHILVLGLSPGLGVTSTCRWLKAQLITNNQPANQTDKQTDPPVITDAGFLTDTGYAAADIGTSLNTSRRPDGQLADMLVLLHHLSTPPEKISALLQRVTSAYLAAGQPAPHMVVRARGCGDAVDTALAAKAAFTDRLLLLLAKSLFAPEASTEENTEANTANNTANNTDYATACALYAPTDLEISD